MATYLVQNEIVDKHVDCHQDIIWIQPIGVLIQSTWPYFRHWHQIAHRSTVDVCARVVYARTEPVDVNTTVGLVQS